MSVSNCCHQCKRNNRGKVVRCLKCKRRRYCVPCITNWYPLMSEKDFEQACPVCIGNCNCIYCLRSKVPTGDAASLKSSEGDFSRYASYMLKMILPFMRHICEEQEKEKMLEAETHGLLSLSRLKIEAAESELNKHMNCDNCKAYILDLHRSCTHCSYKICLTCSREVCEGCLQGVGEDEIMQLIDPGEEYLHGVGKYNVSSEKGGPLENPNGSRGENFVKPASEWRLDKDGSIPCPPKSMHGCGEGMLKLKHILGENQLSSLLWRANALSENHLLKDIFETSEKGCTCANSCDMDTSGGNLRKAASRENSDDNYLYSPTAVEIKASDWKHFRSHLYKGEPIIVNNVLETTRGLSWEPMVIWRAFRQIKNKKHSQLLNAAGINCLGWREVDTNLHQFFTWYREGQFDNYGWPQIINLTDWPPNTIFNDHAPRHSAEFISSLPFKEYTHPYTGHLNLAARPPYAILMPDLVPKMNIACGVAPELGRGDSVTNIHYDKCDTVCVLMHAQPIELTTSQLHKIKSLKKQHHYQDQHEIYGNGKIINETKQHDGDIVGGLQNTDGGAIWDIFRRDDISKLEAYLRKHFNEFRHRYCFPVEKVVHPIHDQIFYLSKEHKQKLKAEYGIEPWSFVQKVGDAVFVPAGCPYQVRNIKSCIKVSMGLVSPENVSQCIRLADEYRVLPRNHSAKKDMLEVQKLIVHAIEQAANDLENLDAEPMLHAEDSLQSSKASEDSSVKVNSFSQLLGSDAECIPCLSNEGENCCQGPSAMEAEALTEGGGKEDHPSYGTTMSNIASEKELEVVPHSTSSATSMSSASAVCASPNISHLTPRSLPTKTVGFFKELADMLQGDKFDQVLPPQVQLDKQIISDYELVLKIVMSRDLRELCKDSRHLEFIEVLTGLLACRKIPSNLHQGFLSLRHDLPALATRVLELNMKLRHGLTQKLNRCVMKELTGCMDSYHACEHKLLKLEQEKESVTGRQNDSIDAEISRLTAEAEELLKACAAKSHKLSSLDVGDERHDSDYERSLEELIKLENEWRQRVSTLKF